MLNASLSGQLPTGAREFQELLTTRQVCPHYQPIVATNGELYGYELLGRGAHSALPVSPGPLFQLAESLGLAVELSELFRYEGVRLAANAGCTRLFMNIHPAELTDLTRLMHSLQQLKSLRGSMELLLEIHEHCVTGLPLMSRIKEGVEALGIHLAYDDFGAGQARLVELVDAPPTVLKFDISLVRGVANASQKRQQMLRMLIGFCQEQGILSLAECLEDEADVAVCRKLGFDLMQGFYFSVPKPVQSMAQ
jgi:EAL domain-containing protein (putative c-di-GMP-specific phosphodiesterase class I)